MKQASVAAEDLEAVCHHLADRLVGHSCWQRAHSTDVQKRNRRQRKKEGDTVECGGDLKIAVAS